MARQASVATDSRFLRVLDAVYSDDDEIGSYIVCEYATGQSLELLLSHGPLSGLEAAWVVREVADALSGVHSLGLYHQRINPDTVILTPDGHVKIVGLLIEEALRPPPGSALLAPDPAAGPPAPEDGRRRGSRAGCSTPAWCRAGPADRRSACPPRPSTGRHWLSPRQVRAGVSPALDNVYRPDPRRPAPAPRPPAADRQRRGQRAHRRARPRRRLRGPRAAAAATDPPGDHHPAAGADAPRAGGPSGPRWPRVPPGRTRAIPISPTITSDDVTRVTVIRQPPPPVPTKRFRSRRPATIVPGAGSPSWR